MSYVLVWRTIVFGCDVYDLALLLCSFVGGRFNPMLLLFVLKGLSAPEQVLHTVLFLDCQVGYAGSRGSEWLSHKE